MDRPASKILKIATTLTTEFQDPRFAAIAASIDVPARLDSKKQQEFNLRDELRLFWGVLTAAFRYPALLLFSSRGYFKPELMATVLTNIIPKRFRPNIFFYGEMYQPNSGIRMVAEKIAMWLANRVVDCFIVYSQQDKISFSHTWGIDLDKIRVSPYYTMHTEGEAAPRKTGGGKHIFSGGKSFRNLEPVIEAARRRPELDFVLATDKLNGRSDLPKNIKAGLVSYEEYNHLINSSAAIVIPLQTGLKRSTGMLTYLEAMWAKNPIIITNALGVSEYVQDRKTGLIVDGTCDGYLTAIDWILDPENSGKIREMCENAHDVVIKKFSFENHISHMLDILDEFYIEGLIH